MNYVTNFVDRLSLSQYNQVSVVKSLAAKTNQKPEHISLAIFCVTVMVLLFTAFGHNILMMLVSFLYPAYRSFQALETPDPEDDRRWLVYWTVFGFIYAFKGVFESVLSFLPGSSLILTLLLFTIYSPMTNGYEYVYTSVIRPVLLAYHSTIDKYLGMAQEEVRDKTRRGAQFAAEKYVSAQMQNAKAVPS